MAASSPNEELLALLCRSRRGGIHELHQCPEGSAEWNDAGQPIPACLLLHDLEIGSLPLGFGSDPMFATVTELDLSGNRLTSLPPDMFESMKCLRVLFLGGPGPKFTPEGASCNMLESLPQLKYLVHLEHLSLHDNQLTTLPELANCAVLHTLRLDRNPLPELPVLPPSLRVLHLEGCPLGGTLDLPENLPVQVRALPRLEDLQLPDGSHIGEFFGTPLPSLLRPRLPGDLLPKIDGTESLYAPESQSNSTEEIKEKAV
mmetsp:Transcript_36867/g.42886  ORF Transcript_36867/g.42886 Transcript_36867/m.42886 type:complete len:259 (-) Transcript_36867:11-787(-)